MSLYIFGYGSLLFPHGINGRGLSHTYSTEDLTEAWICGYRREWNACHGTERFLGLVPEPAGFVNGVIFSLDANDFSNFARSECSLAIPPLYNFVDIRRQLGIDPECSVVLQPDDQVLTCVTAKPSFDGQVSQSYLNLVKQAVKSRGPGFESEFWTRTPKPC